MSEHVEQLVEAWRTNHGINAEGLRCPLSKRGGRTVARQFAHLHYVRIYNLKNRAKAVAAGATLFASKGVPSIRRPATLSGTGTACEVGTKASEHHRVSGEGGEQA